MILLAMTLSAIVSSSILAPLYPNAARTSSYATPITRMASGSNEWDEPRRNFLNGIGRLVQRTEQLSRLGPPVRKSVACRRIQDLRLRLFSCSCGASRSCWKLRDAKRARALVHREEACGLHRACRGRPLRYVVRPPASLDQAQYVHGPATHRTTRAFCSSRAPSCH